MNKKILFLIKTLITGSFLFLCIRKIDVGQLPILFKSIDIYCLPYIIFFNLLFIFLGAINISILINSIVKIPILRVVQYYTFCWCLTLISPGQLGDVSLLLFFKKEKIPFHDTGSVYIIDKIVTLVIYLTIATVGLSLSLRGFAYILYVFVGAIVICLLSCLALALVLKRFNQFRYLQRIYDFFVKTMQGVMFVIRNHNDVIFLNFLLTIIKTLVMVLMYYLAFNAFHINVANFNLVFITVISAIVAYLPISLGGVGVVEFCAIYLWSQLGVPEEVVLGAYALLRLNNIILGFVVFVYFTIRFKSRTLKSLNQKTASLSREL